VDTKKELAPAKTPLVQAQFYDFARTDCKLNVLNVGSKKGFIARVPIDRGRQLRHSAWRGP
jgi:hypothetical protein